MNKRVIYADKLRWLKLYDIDETGTSVAVKAVLLEDIENSPTVDIVGLVSEQFKIPREDLHELLLAYKDCRLKIASRGAGEHCETCAHYRAKLGKMSGFCGIRYVKDTELSNLPVRRTRLACKKYKPREE